MTCHRPVSSSNIIDHHNITEILFNVVLNTIIPPPPPIIKSIVMYVEENKCLLTSIQVFSVLSNNKLDKCVPKQEEC